MSGSQGSKTVNVQLENHICGIRNIYIYILLIQPAFDVKTPSHFQSLTNTVLRILPYDTKRHEWDNAEICVRGITRMWRHLWCNFQNINAAKLHLKEVLSRDLLIIPITWIMVMRRTCWFFIYLLRKDRGYMCNVMCVSDDRQSMVTRTPRPEAMEGVYPHLVPSDTLWLANNPTNEWSTRPMRSLLLTNRRERPSFSVPFHASRLTARIFALILVQNSFTIYIHIYVYIDIYETGWFSGWNLFWRALGRWQCHRNLNLTTWSVLPLTDSCKIMNLEACNQPLVTVTLQAWPRDWQSMTEQRLTRLRDPQSKRIIWIS